VVARDSTVLYSPRNSVAKTLLLLLLLSLLFLLLFIIVIVIFVVIIFLFSYFYLTICFLAPSVVITHDCNYTYLLRTSNRCLLNSF